MHVKELEATILVDSKNILGEGVVWHKQGATLMWVDIDGMCVNEYNFESKQTQTWQIGFKVSLIVETAEIDVLRLALQGGIVDYNLSTNELMWIAHIENDNPEVRTNDGSLDNQGRLWIGTMRVDCADGGGALHMLDHNHNVEVKLTPCSIPNGMVWTADNKRLYHVDSATYKVASYIVDYHTGDITFEKYIITIPQELGMPDGMCQDDKGMLWIAIWGGAGVYGYNPETGENIGKVAVPAPQITSCTFDPTYSRMFITSATTGMSDEDLKKYPLSGGLFVAQF